MNKHFAAAVVFTMALAGSPAPPRSLRFLLFRNRADFFYGQLGSTGYYFYGQALFQKVARSCFFSLRNAAYPAPLFYFVNIAVFG